MIRRNSNTNTFEYKRLCSVHQAYDSPALLFYFLWTFKASETVCLTDPQFKFACLPFQPHSKCTNNKITNIFLKTKNQQVQLSTYAV